MWMDKLLGSRVTHALALTAAFTENRQQVLADNVANIDTPDYHFKRLDADKFQRELDAALSTADRKGESQLKLSGGSQTRTDAEGRLQTRPAEAPPAHVLFHDGTNAFLEKTMASVMENRLHYNFATTLLGRRFEGLQKAIRGRQQ